MSIVLTQDDYTHFEEKKKYLSAKLLTYFAEHPLFFIGYSCSDPNITAILSDIDEILAPNGELIPNIYIVNYDQDFDDSKNYQTEVLIPINGQKSVRIKALYSNDFTWVFDALSQLSPEITINPKLLRALLARTYKLVTTELPKKEVAFDLKLLKDISEDNSELPKLFGISELNNGQLLNASYIFTLTEVGKKLGYKSWHYADHLLGKIRDEKGVDIKASDNAYHVRISVGKSAIGKYSQSLVDLLKLVQAGQDYDIKL